MKELYEQLGLIEATIISLQQQLSQLKNQKKYLLKTLENADQSLHSEESRTSSS